MKLIIQIPCLNEAGSLAATVADLPCKVPGFDTVEVLVVDDGSTDGTAALARSLGVDHVISLPGNHGLARAFMAGVATACKLGADVIVNTDADNQYRGADIANLVEPIVEGRADIVIGSRPIKSIRHFSPLKRLFQILGSFVVRVLSGTTVEDAPSGFRALTRNAAFRLNTFNSFTYTIETTIQAGLCNLRVVSVPVQVNEPRRPSRLFKSNLGYICRSFMTMLSAYVIYRPRHLFSALALLFLVPGFLLGLRYLYLMWAGEGVGHVQSVIASGVLVVCGVFMGAIGVVAHLQAINRHLLEEVVYHARAREVAERIRQADEAGPDLSRGRMPSSREPGDLRTANEIRDSSVP